MTQAYLNENNATPDGFKTFNADKKFDVRDFYKMIASKPHKPAATYFG